MIELESVTMRNFLSYGNVPTMVLLNRLGTTLIVGENGVGKTVLLNAITYALYDKPVSDMSKDGLVNNINKKKMEVTLSFKANGNEYVVKRQRKMKAGAAGNTVFLYINGEDKTPSSVDKTNEAILKIIRYPYDLFVRVVAFSATHKSFLDLPVRHVSQANQTDIIEELFDLKTLSEKAVLLKQHIKDTELSLKTTNTYIEQVEKEHERHKSQVVSAIGRVVDWEQQHRQNIEDTQAKLDKIESVDFSAIAKLNDRIREIDNELVDPIKKIEELQEQIEVLEEKHDKISSEKQDAKNRKTKIERELQQSINNQKKLEREETRLVKERDALEDEKCHYCLQKHPNAGDQLKIVVDDLSKITQQLSGVAVESDDLSMKIKVIDEEIQKFTQLLSEDDEEIQQITDKQKALSNICGTLQKEKTAKNVELNAIDVEDVSKKSHYEKKIEELSQTINPFLDPLEELENMKLDPINTKKVNTLTKTIEHQKFLLKLLTKKDSFVRKTLLDRNIPFLNQRLSHYLSELELPHRVEFTHEMTAKVTQFGNEMSFGNLSTGQRSRVNIAISFAFRDVLQYMHDSVNVCVLDEVLDAGLDTKGVRIAAKMLKRQARDGKMSIFIISHRDEIDSAFDHRLIVQLESNFTTINFEG